MPNDRSQAAAPSRMSPGFSLPDIRPGEGIPRKLHHIFLEGWSALPRPFAENIAALRARNPGWQPRFWDAPTGEAFIAEVYGAEVLALYRRVDPRYYAARGDLLRYLVVHAEGGVYLDVKSSVTPPIDTILKPDDAFLLSQKAGNRDLPAEKGWIPELRPVLAGDGYE